MVEVTQNKLSNLTSDIEKQVLSGLERGMKKSASLMESQLDTAFDNEGIRRGKRSTEWIQTTEIAAANRKNPPTKNQLAYGTYKTLVDTGNMRRSITTVLNKAKALWEQFTGASVDYIKTHEKGGKFKGKDVPPRPNQYWLQEDIDEASKLIAEELKRG